MTIRESFDQLRDAAMSPLASQPQVDESCRFFFAGAWHILNELEHISSDAVSEEEGCRLLSALRDETVAYFAAMAAGAIKAAADQEADRRRR